jgi:hypothetical protein
MHAESTTPSFGPIPATPSPLAPPPSPPSFPPAPPSQVYNRRPFGSTTPPSNPFLLPQSHSGRLLCPNPHFTNFDLSLATLSPDPTTFATAVQDPRWQAAMDREMESNHKHATWRLTDLLPGCTAITTKWLYKTKLNADGSPATYKA